MPERRSRYAVPHRTFVPMDAPAAEPVLSAWRGAAIVGHRDLPPRVPLRDDHGHSDIAESATALNTRGTRAASCEGTCYWRLLLKHPGRERIKRA